LTSRRTLWARVETGWGPEAADLDALDPAQMQLQQLDRRDLPLA
jgi:hypothetical protein